MSYPKSNEEIAAAARGEAPKVKHHVTVFGDHKLEFPELYLAVYVHGDRHEKAAFAEMLVRSRCHQVQSPEEADLVIFTGGPDIDPLYYNEPCHSSVHFNTKRDTSDVVCWAICYDLGIPVLGICRGAQFGHAMMGGKLYQHVDGHHGDHSMFDRDDKDLIERISSVHHQMVIDNTKGGMKIIGTSGGSKERWHNPTKVDHGPATDIEAFFYRDTCFLGIQGHPEYRGYNYFAYWTMKKIDEYMIKSPDTYYDRSRLRLRPDFMAQRDKVAIPTTNIVVLPTQEKK